jgi:hypothetical protein
MLFKLKYYDSIKMLFKLKYYDSNNFSLLERIDMKLDNGIEEDRLLKFAVVATVIITAIVAVYKTLPR